MQEAFWPPSKPSASYFPSILYATIFAAQSPSYIFPYSNIFSPSAKPCPSIIAVTRVLYAIFPSSRQPWFKHFTRSSSFKFNEWPSGQVWIESRRTPVARTTFSASSWCPSSSLELLGCQREHQPCNSKKFFGEVEMVVSQILYILYIYAGQQRRLAFESSLVSSLIRTVLLS